MPHVTITVTVVRCPPRPANVNKPVVRTLANGDVVAAVTVCADSSYVFRIDGPAVDITHIVNGHPPRQRPISTGHEHGNGIKIDTGGRPGINTIDAEVTVR